LVFIDRAEAIPVFKVIDVKATQLATSFHKAQVAFYALVLAAQLRDHGLSGKIAEKGEIWHLKPGDSGEDGEYQVTEFFIDNYMNLVIDFFATTVTRLEKQQVDKSRDETFFHLYFKCEQCPYLDHCIKSIQKEPQGRDLSAIPGLTHEAKKALWRFGIRDLKSLVEAKGLRGKNLQSWALKSRLDQLRNRAESLITRRVTRRDDFYTYMMPPRIDVGLYLVADSDPVQGNLATLGYLLDWQGRLEFEVAVIQDGNPQSELLGLKRVMGKLISDLVQLDTHNRSCDSQGQLYSHILLYEPSEAKDIQRAIGRHLEDPEIRGCLLHLVRIFPPEETIPEPEYRGIHHLPASALRSALEQLYSLPVLVSFDLRQTSQAIADSDPSFSDPYIPAKGFASHFSSRLSINRIRDLRDRKMGIQAIEADVSARLKTIQGLTQWLLQQSSRASQPFLRLAKKPFLFQCDFNPLSSVALDILHAYELLANKSELLNRLILLALPWQQRRDSMNCLARLKLLKVDKIGFAKYRLHFEIPPESQDADLSASDLGLILTDDDVNKRLHSDRWKSFQVSLVEDNLESNRVKVEIQKRVYEGEEFKQLMRDAGQDCWYVDKSYVDFNAELVNNFFLDLSEGANRR